jgi:hypothetical protein
MKTIINKSLFIAVITLFLYSCEDLEQINIDPSNPSEVPSNILFSGTQKKSWIMCTTFGSAVVNV